MLEAELFDEAVGGDKVIESKVPLKYARSKIRSHTDSLAIRFQQCSHKHLFGQGTALEAAPEHQLFRLTWREYNSKLTDNLNNEIEHVEFAFERAAPHLCTC